MKLHILLLFHMYLQILEKFAKIRKWFLPPSWLLCMDFISRQLICSSTQTPNSCRRDHLISPKRPVTLVLGIKVTRSKISSKSKTIWSWPMVVPSFHLSVHQYKRQRKKDVLAIVCHLDCFLAANSSFSRSKNSFRILLSLIKRFTVENVTKAHLWIKALELRQYKNNSDQFEPIPCLKLPRFFNHRLSHAWANQQHVFSEC